MAQIIDSQCPRCGAALEVDPHREVAACQYCGHRSVIAWGGSTQTPTAPIPQGQTDPEQAARASRNVLVAVVVAMVVALAIAGTAIGLTTGRGMPSLLSGGTRVDGPDPHKVDIAEVIRQARAVAIAQEPHADSLSSVVAFNVTGGLLDTTQQNAGSISFSFRYKDPTKAPGQKDVVEGSVNVHVTGGTLNGMRMDAFFVANALGDPKCTSRAAWSTAVTSGVPENAVTTFMLYGNAVFTPQSATVWSIRVDGHDDFRREIDATTCALVRSWAKPAGRE